MAQRKDSDQDDLTDSLLEDENKRNSINADEFDYTLDRKTDVKPAAKIRPTTLRISQDHSNSLNRRTEYIDLKTRRQTMTKD